MKDKLLILGSLGEFVQLVQMAKDRGILVYVCDRYKEGPAKKIAYKSYDIDVGETQEIVKICMEEGINGILTSFSDYLLECMVKIAEQAKLKCYLKPEQLKFYRNKEVMKEMFHQLGIGTPKHISLEKNFSEHLLAGFRYPVVVKPLDKYGSRGVLVLPGTKEIREYFDESCATSEIKKILAEEYHSGFEFNLMAWIHNGEAKVLSIADREKTAVGGKKIPISTRNVYPSRMTKEVAKEAGTIVQKIAAFTGQEEGALSMQFFWSAKTGIQVCEVAARFFGYEHELLEYCSGFCLEKLLLDYVYEKTAVEAALNAYRLPAADRRNSGENEYDCCAVLYFHGQEGKIVDQRIAGKLGKLPGVVKCELFYQEGESIELFGPQPYVVRYYITGKDYHQIDQLTRRIFTEISVTDENGHEILYRNQMPDYELFE